MVEQLNLNSEYVVWQLDSNREYLVDQLELKRDTVMQTAGFGQEYLLKSFSGNLYVTR